MNLSEWCVLDTVYFPLGCHSQVLLALFRLFHLPLLLRPYSGIHLLPFPPTSSAFLHSYSSFLSPFVSFLAFATHVLSSCPANGNSTTCPLKGSYFPGRIQFVLATYMHINHSEGFIYKKRNIRAYWGHFPLGNRWPFASHEAARSLAALREVFSFLTFI